MTAVGDMLLRTGFDMSLNAELILGADSAIVHVGSMGYDSGFVMVCRDGGLQDDELGRPLFDWRLLDGSGELVLAGEEFCDLEGGTHPIEVLASLIDAMRGSAERGADGFEGVLADLDDDAQFWMREYVAGYLPDLLDALRQAIAHLE